METVCQKANVQKLVKNAFWKPFRSYLKLNVSLVKVLLGDEITKFMEVRLGG